MTLDEVQADAFRRLTRGVADRRSPARNPALATRGLDGGVSVRTVVLRNFDPVSRTLCLHSDVRTAKIAEVRADPRVMLHVWDAASQVQLRILGRAWLRLGAEARADWDRLHPGSKATYAVRPTPSSPIKAPEEADTGQLQGSEALLNFAVIDVMMDSLDSLRLARTGNRRARFAWSGSSETACWIVP